MSSTLAAFERPRSGPTNTVFKSGPLFISSKAATMTGGADTEITKGRLTDLLFQLQIECGIFDRMIYKNKNQHRRCSYFQRLLKVKRDLKLLDSVRMEELVDSCFYTITEGKPKQKVHLLESLKRRKCETGSYNFLERLLGAARLLSQMVEPILKAASEISILFARSHFREFSLTIMALLARLRVLVQQILLDVIVVFNEVSSIAQRKQSIKITQDGVEVFREYYPKMEHLVTLDCVWRTDKFALVEKTEICNTRHPTKPVEGGELVATTSVQYQTISTFLGNGENEVDAEEEDLGADIVTAKWKPVDDPLNPDDDGFRNSIRGQNLLEGGNGSSSSPISAFSVRSKCMAKKKVAFISVKKPENLAATMTENRVGASENQRKNEDKQDPFFSLLTGGTLKDGLFEIE